MTEGLLGPRALRDLLARHGVRPSRALGQHFVIDPNTIRRVVEVAALDRDARVLEIGAGAGSLTLALAVSARRVVAVELDRALLPVLAETLRGVDNVEVRHADALRLDLAALDANHLVGNLPYNIATPLVLEVLRRAPAIERLTVMTQAEVGERLAAEPGSKTYGQASAVVAFHARASIAVRVSRRAFYPVPRVESVVVSLVRRPPPAGVDPDAFAAAVRSAFAQRRKTLRNALAPLAGSPEEAASALASAGIDPGARAETVSPAAFAELARVLGERLAPPRR